VWVERLARSMLQSGLRHRRLLAAQAAFGTGGKTTDTQGALQTIPDSHLEGIGLVAIGLIGYVLAFCGNKDPETKARTPVWHSLGYAVNG